MRSISILSKTLALAGLAVLAGCAYPNPRHVAELNGLVGKSEPDLLRSQGVPSRTYDTSGLRFVSYQMTRIESFPGDGFGPGFGYGGFGGFGYDGGFGGFGYGGGFGSEIIQRDCNTTFELKAGVVQSWSLRGNDC